MDPADPASLIKKGLGFTSWKRFSPALERAKVSLN